jgi:hypothetical protein
MQIDRISADVWPVDRPHWVRLSNVPHFDVIVPTSGHEKVGVVLIKFDAKNSVGVTWLSGTSSLQVSYECSCLLIVDTHHTIRPRSCELCALRIIIDSKQLVKLVPDGVKQLARCGMPMLQRSIGVDSNNDVLGDSLTRRRSPP